MMADNSTLIAVAAAAKSREYIPATLITMLADALEEADRG